MKFKYLILCLFAAQITFSQKGAVEEEQTGAWYMYFYNAKFGDSNWGVQGDFQYRHWNLFGDMEQLLLRSGLTYTPDNTNVLFTLGYANITTGTPGDSDSTFGENRIYQEALVPQKISNRFFLNHRFRYEQRWVDDQDFRTRFRYNLFINVTLNDTDFNKGTYYLAFYNELFMNGERTNGNNTLELFDRNRTYFGLGYVLSKSSRVQLGWMRQESDNWTKGQLQFSLHQNLNF